MGQMHSAKWMLWKGSPEHPCGQHHKATLMSARLPAPRRPPAGRCVAIALAAWSLPAFFHVLCPGLRQDHNLLLQLLGWEQEVPHDLVQLLQGQLGMELGHIIGFQTHHVLQQVIEILEDIAQHLDRETGS